MTDHLGWYVHHHGRGHATRARAVLPHLRTPATVLTSADPGGWPAPVVELPLDLPPDGRPPDPSPLAPVPDLLHYAPVGVPGLRDRVAAITRWIADTAPALLVVDVSVEVALLARIAGVPIVTVRQHGDRRDPAHRAVYAASSALLAPWPELLEDPTIDPDVRARTWCVGGFSRFDARRGEVVARPDDAGTVEIVVVSGGGGAGISADDVAAAAGRTPGWRWTVLGGPGASDAPPSHGNVDWRGWVDDPFPDLVRADVVVATAGHNTVMECAAAAARLVVIAEDRPYGEQRAKARALADVGAAVSLGSWPAPDAWPEVLARASTLDPSVLAGMVDGEGARRAARLVDGLVAQLAEVAR